MAFVDLPCGRGKLYVPETQLGMVKKHRCPDCFSCQMCGEERCKVCRAGQKTKGEKGGNRGCPRQQCKRNL